MTVLDPPTLALRRTRGGFFLEAALRSHTPTPTPDEQVETLMRLGMNIPDREGALRFLRHIRAGVVREYLPPRDEASGLFHPGADFGGVVHLFGFDRELRLLAVDAAGRVEVSVRAQMVARGILPDEDAADKKKRITMGKLARHYNDIASPALRQEIADVYEMDEKILSSFLIHLTVVRNDSAHHKCLWNSRFKVCPVLPAKKPALKPFFNLNARDKIYNTLVILAHLTDVIPPPQDWARQLLALLESCDEECETAMGFPAGWRAAEFWRRRTN